VVHEVAERAIMRDLGWGYEAAHEVASAAERALRDALSKGGTDAG
jgi:hypothetical protein